MLETITRLVQPIVRIKQDEWRKATLMFLCFAFSIATLYILKPIRSSLFLTAHGAENLRYAYVGEGLFLIFITFAYSKLSRWLVHKNVLFSVATGFFVSNIVVFWFLFKAGYLEWLSYIFYFWVAAYSITIVTQCWTLANDIFDPQEAKRLFGFIISGGSLGGIIGGLVTNQFAERLGTENLLLVVGGLLCMCIVLMNAAWKYEHVQNAGDAAKKTSGSSAVNEREESIWKVLFSSRYLILIMALVMIAKVASTIVDNQFNSVVETTIVAKNARTAFFSGFMALLNGVSFVMQLIVASYVLRHLGIGISLLLLPIGLCLCSTATIFLPILAVAGAAKVYDGSFNYSINQLSKEILYLPIPSQIRYRVKPFIDMLAYRVSKTLAGLLIIVFAPLLGIPDQKLGVIVLLLAPLWILAAWGVRDEYMQSIRKLLGDSKKTKQTSHAEGTIKAGNILVNLEGEHSFDQLRRLLDHPSSVTRKISAAACHAFYSSIREMQRVKKMVQEMVHHETFEFAHDLEHFFQENVPAHESRLFDRRLLDFIKPKSGDASDLKTLLRCHEKEVLLKVSECFNDSKEEVRMKQKAVLILIALGTQAAVDFLVESLTLAQDHSFRFTLVRALHRIRTKGEQRFLNTPLIKKEIISEIKMARSILSIIEKYREGKSDSELREDYLFAAFQAIQEEVLERTFRLLTLLYDPDLISVIYDRLTETDGDKHVKANALELLENVLTPELYRPLYPIFDEMPWPETSKKALDVTVQEFLESQDPWLSVCTIFLIVEMRLEEFYPQLNRLTQSQAPMLKEAAGIALTKIQQLKV